MPTLATAWKYRRALWKYRKPLRKMRGVWKHRWEIAAVAGVGLGVFGAQKLRCAMAARQR